MLHAGCRWVACGIIEIRSGSGELTFSETRHKFPLVCRCVNLWCSIDWPMSNCELLAPSILIFITLTRFHGKPPSPPGQCPCHQCLHRQRWWWGFPPSVSMTTLRLLPADAPKILQAVKVLPMKVAFSMTRCLLMACPTVWPVSPSVKPSKDMT